MSSDKKVANAISGKTARACDSCLRKRARWYCAADDAFLCQGCDSSVHSANSLARRHERVRLKTASFKPSEDLSVVPYLPAWHQGFTRKARTPRHARPTLLHRPKTEEEPLPNPLPLVPDLGNDETSLDENEEQLLYRVPIFDPLVADYCTSTTSNEVAATTNDAATAVAAGSESKVVLPDYGTGDGNNLPGFLSSDMDLAEFAADVESLLGRGLDDDSFGMEGLGLLDSKDEDIKKISFETGRVKVEEGEEEVGDAEAVVACHLDPELDTARETLEFNFDYESPTTAEEEEEEKVVAGSAMMLMNGGLKTEEDTMTGSISLRLDYKAVITAWASQGSPWTTGDRPQLNPDNCWPEFLGMYPIDVHHVYEDMGGEGGQMAMGDGGREARVSRYREKRRTRLFSKKIRYEVRKLNAEKRPRMKGRFVKRSSFAGPAFPF